VTLTSPQNRRLLLAILAVACINASCRPYIGLCGWLEPTGDTAIHVTGARNVTAPQECDCVRCSAPGKFQVLRSGYMLELWNGNRWYPELQVRATSPSGEKLTLRSDQLTMIKGGTLDYMLEGIAVGSRFTAPQRLNFTVQDSKGKTLGTESIALRLETRRHLSVESI
jgi:hypothetical protein